MIFQLHLEPIHWALCVLMQTLAPTFAAPQCNNTLLQVNVVDSKLICL